MPNFERLAENGDVKKQIHLAWEYAQGNRGRVNQLPAAVWFLCAQKKGTAGAKFALLALCFRLAPYYARPILLTQTIFLLLKVPISKDVTTDLDCAGSLLHRLKPR